MPIPLLLAAAAAAPALPASHSILSPIATPVADVLAAFYAIVPNVGVAIMMLSVAWMILIAPLTLKSTRSMLAMQKLQPQLKKIQAEHKNDRQAFAQAQMDLYKEHNVSPFGSCLPTLLPLPVFFALFRVIDGLSHRVNVGGHVVADPSFLSSHTALFQSIVRAGGHINAFGLDLSKNALSGHSSVAAAAPFYILLLVMIGTQYLQTAQMMNRNKAAQDNPQMKFMKYLPLIFGVVSIRFPAGVILYYATSNVCRMAQQTAMYRWDPKVKTLYNQEVKEVEADIRRLERQHGTAPNDAPSGRSAWASLLDSAREQSARSREAKATPKDLKGGQGAKPAAAGGAKGAERRPESGRSTKRPVTPAPRANGTSQSPQGAKPAAKAQTRNGSSAIPAPGPAASASGNGASGANGAKANGKPARVGTTNQGTGTVSTGKAPDRPANGSGAQIGSHATGRATPPSPVPVSPDGKTPAATGGRTGAQTPRTPKKRRGR